MAESDLYFMSLAIAQAVEAEQAGEVPVGAVIVKDNKVIAVGRNRTIEWNDPSAHAEVVALRTAAIILGTHRMSELELFITLEPCSMCSGAIFHSRLARVVYGAPDPKTGCAGSVVNLFGMRQLNHHTRVTSGVMFAECAALLSNFFKRNRQLKAKSFQPLREDSLRTPMTAFAGLNLVSLPGQYFYSSDGFRLHYLHLKSETSSTTLLCLHDLPFWSYDLTPWLDKLRTSGHTLLIPDLLGCGLSDKPKKSTSHTTFLHARLVKEIIVNLEISSFDVLVFGSSLSIARAILHEFGSIDTKLIHVRIKENSHIKNIKLSKRPTISNGIDDLASEAMQYIHAPFFDQGYTAIFAGMMYMKTSAEDHIESNQTTLNTCRGSNGLSLQSLDAVLVALDA